MDPSAEFDKALKASNDRLKSASIGVRIERRGAKLSLKATLPAKPGSNAITRRQQRVSLGISANVAGLKIAEAKAKVLDGQLGDGSFRWERWVQIDDPEDVEQRTIGELLPLYEAWYFRDGATPSKRNTWHKNYWLRLNKLPMDALLDEAVLRRTIEAYSERHQRARQDFHLAYSGFAKWAGVTVNLDDLRSTYSSRSVDVDVLPTDDQIIAAWERIPYPEWKWVFGMMATYGLRNHGIFFVTDWDKFTDPPHIIRVIEKTNEHFAMPYPIEWVRLFGLTHVRLPTFQWRKPHPTPNDYGSKVTQRFASLGPYLEYRSAKGTDHRITPYQLRHAWACRTLANPAIDNALAAKLQGHSPEIHHKIYQRAIDRDHLIKAWDGLG